MCAVRPIDLLLGATLLCLFGLGALMSAVVLDTADDDEGGANDKDAYRLKVTVGGGSANLPGAHPGRSLDDPPPLPPPPQQQQQQQQHAPLLQSKVKAALPIGAAAVRPTTAQTSVGGVAAHRPPSLTTGSDVSLSAKPATSSSSSSSSSAAAAAAASVAAAAAHSFPDRDYSLKLDGEVWTDFTDSFDQPAAGGSQSFTVWIYIDPKTAEEKEMRTVLANRNAGCDLNSQGLGFAMFINAWTTNDRSVQVEFGTATEGCSRVSTPAGAVPVGRWTQVGLVINQVGAGSAGTTEVAITVNGEVRAHHVVARGNTRSSQHLRLGAHVDGQGHFKGNISELVIWSRSILDASQQRTTPDTQGRLVAGNTPLKGNEPQLLAYYPLDWSDVDQGKAGRKLRARAEDAGSQHHTAATVLLPTLGGGLGGPGGDSELASSLNAADLAHLSTDVAASMNWSPKELAAGTYPDHVSEVLMTASADVSRKRALAVKAAMQHSWNGYKRRAWGFDELKPQSGRGQNNWGGMGVTLLDSLDTLWLMGMKAEFAEAAEWCATKLNFNIGRTVSTFETTIRSLGGLLSAYDMSGNKMFLDKALDLGRRLYKAFNTPSGIPVGQVNLQTGAGHNAAWTSSASVLSEIGTLQVEFRYLAEVTGNQEMFNKVTKVFETVRKNNAMSDGLAPIYVSPQTGRFTTSRVTFGALGDSWYEYLLKCWLQGGKTEAWLRDMYDKSMDGMINKLLKRSHPSNLAYVSDWDGSRNVHKMDHLVCFLPGILALGAYTKPDSPNRDRDMMVAKSLMYTCYQMYARMETGIAPEYVDFPGGGDLKPASRAPFYILRPETAESLFVLHQITVSPSV
jgi:mannosyl-oligosaccharide alpha-1,2-mannosidase